MNDVSAVFTFPTTHHALKAEEVLKFTSIKATVIPVPREINSLCGIAIKVASEHRSAVEAKLTRQGVKIERVYLIHNKNRRLLQND